MRGAIKVRVLQVSAAGDKLKDISFCAGFALNGGRTKFFGDRTFLPEFFDSCRQGVSQAERLVVGERRRRIERAVAIETKAVPAGVAEIEFNARLRIRMALDRFVVIELHSQLITKGLHIARQAQ